MPLSINKIGLFTSGGDAPGMNACIRSVVRTALHNNLMVSGIIGGYNGMITGDIIPMTSRSVSNIIQRGGTILKAARSKEFMTAEGRQKAFNNLKANSIDALVAIGGDGTFKGADQFIGEHNVRIIGIPGTIDNDLKGTDYTLGFDTAINTVIEAVDKIRDTAASHNRLFFVEVMGRDSGCIALSAGIGAGAEYIMMPERNTSIDELVQVLEEGARNNKSSSIVIVAEGNKAGSAYEIASAVKARFNYYDTRVTVLGHIQRGGSPTCADRILAARLGVAAVESLLEGKNAQMVGLINNQIQLTPFSEAVKDSNRVNSELIKISALLS